ncbi:hypothetical protein [Methanoregula sp.]|uniref:hypothetical protein n=1 Tax=Methanoregula sp. TaxID=2052170 RepID=UPI003568C43A
MTGAAWIFSCGLFGFIVFYICATKPSREKFPDPDPLRFQNSRKPGSCHAEEVCGCIDRVIEKADQEWLGRVEPVAEIKGGCASRLRVGEEARAVPFRHDGTV